MILEKYWQFFLHTAVVLSVTAVFGAAVSGGFTYRGSPVCNRGIRCSGKWRFYIPR
jgi:hypothetical protein